MRKVEGNGVGKEENEKDKEEEVYGGGRGEEEEEAEEEKEGEEEEEGLGKPLSAVFCSVKARSFCARLGYKTVLREALVIEPKKKKVQIIFIDFYAPKAKREDRGGPA